MKKDKENIAVGDWAVCEHPYLFNQPPVTIAQVLHVGKMIKLTSEGYQSYRLRHPKHIVAIYSTEDEARAAAQRVRDAWAFATPAIDRLEEILRDTLARRRQRCLDVL